MSRVDVKHTEGQGAGRSMTRIRKILWTGLFMLMGLGAATYLHWPALTNPLIYKSDVRQSPHWAAYHTDSFRNEDLILKLAAHNESPIQNLIYYIGTFVADMVTLGKWLAVIGYGLTAALFFWLGHSMLGFRGGALASICFTFFPDQFNYFAGGFSKAWMIPLILVCVYLLEKEAWRWLLLLLPFGAAAYPVSAVLMGAMVLVYLLLEAPGRGRRMLPVLGVLAAASGLALTVLLVKYLFPPEGIGPLVSGDVLREMPEMYRGGMWHYLPLRTLTKELTRGVCHPFMLLSAVVFFLCLGRRGVSWSRPMTALFLASAIFYVLAEISFMALYQPNRYTRYSMAVLLALWHARNWDRVLALIPWRALQALVLVAVLGCGGYLVKDSFRMGKDTSNRNKWVPLNRFIATLPGKILVAGHPEYMDDIPILARRSVLCNHKLSHPWYRDYYAEIRRRTEATFEALYAGGPEPVNRLAREWGVTHLVVVKRYQHRGLILAKKVYVAPYNDFILRISRQTGSFLLSNPPRGSIVYENEALYVIELPLEIPGLSGNASRDQMPRPSRKKKR